MDYQSFVQQHFASPATSIFPTALAEGVEISRLADER
jgi:hypothetical protein